MTFADIVRQIFTKALQLARERLLRKYGDKLDGLVGQIGHVTRDDVEQAIIALKFEQMQLTLAQLDTMRALGLVELQLAEQRARENAEHVETTLVERDGSEVFSSPWPSLKKHTR